MWFVTLALITMGPVVGHWGQYLYGYGADVVAGLESIWWWRETLNLEPQVSQNFLLDYPMGRQIAPLLPTQPYSIALLSMMPFMKEIPIANTLYLIYLVGLAMGMYGLVRQLNVNRLVAVATGSVYMWAPSHLSDAWTHVGWGPMWLPVLFITLVRYAHAPTWKRALLAGFLMGIVALDGPYYGLGAALVLPLFALAFALYSLLVEKEQWFRLLLRSIGHAFPAGAIVLVLVAINYWPYWRSILSKDAVTSPRVPSDLYRPAQQLYMYAAFPWDYVSPPGNHPFLGKLNSRIFNHFLSLDITFPVTKFEDVPPEWLSWTEGVRPSRYHYLGLTNLCLAAFGLITWRKNADWSAGRDVGILFLVMMLLAAPWLSGPPQLPIGLIAEALLKRHLPLVGRLVIVSPSYWIYDVLPQFRVYARFGMLAVMSMVALAGFGLGMAVEKLSPFWPKWRIALLIIIPLMTGLFEYAALPAPYVDLTQLDTLYEPVTSDADTFAVVNLGPGGLRVYRKPTLNSVWWSYIFGWEHVDQVRVLRGLNVRYLVVQSDQPLPAAPPGSLQPVSVGLDGFRTFRLDAEPVPVMVYSGEPLALRHVWQSQISWSWTPADHTLYILTDTEAQLCLQAKLVRPSETLPFTPTLADDDHGQELVQVVYDGEILLIRLFLPPGLHPVMLTPMTGQGSTIMLRDLRFFECSEHPNP